jgi:RNA ligase (TIGR02306 family)
MKSIELLEGLCLDEIIGVIKYEPVVPACLAGQVRGAFPGDVPKTDEERVQKLEHVINRHHGREFYRSEKLDGSSTTIYLKDEFGVCSRNMNLTETEGNLFWQTVRKLDVERKITAYSEAHGGKSFSLQGELVGPGIQNNKLKLKEVTLYFFNILDITEDRFLNLDEVIEALAEMDLKMVPVIERIVLNHTIDELVEVATHKSIINPSVEAEGDVWRPVVENTDPDIGRLSFKAINPKFLLKHEDV